MAEGTEAALRAQTMSEALHWRLAAEALADLDAVAAPDAWNSMERYLSEHVRSRLAAIVAELGAEARRVCAALASGREVGLVRQDVLALRNRYLQVETVLDFFGDAINTRTDAAMRDLLRGLDALASESMGRTLGAVGLDAPPALVYVDKGLGAAILRAGIRLWDGGHPSPAAAIKVTRHNLSFPTALLHETGHQVAHLTGWTGELSVALAGVFARRSPEIAGLWASWAGEIAADVHAFAQAGWAPVYALANVVDGSTRQVYRVRRGDPHPYPLLRVLLNVALCRSWFGPGPWDRVATAWAVRHPVTEAPGPAAAVTAVSLQALDDVVEVCTRRPMNAFGGRPLCSLLDPARVSPAALRALSDDAGGSLQTSAYLRRRDPLRVLALLAGRAIDDPAGGQRHDAALRRWVADLGADAGSARPRGGTTELRAAVP